MLLFCSFASLYANPLDESTRAVFISQVILEADRIEAALNRHTCTAEAQNNWVGRNFLYA